MNLKVALEKNCTRYNFAVLDWNKPSIEFYKAKGAVDLTEKEGWLTFRMEDEAMKKFTQDYKLMFWGGTEMSLINCH